uniref:Transporter n=1 Tax=Ditylenchus dipsaci TaxID=166011 RepID=A0A915CN52_9BILA
MSSLSATTSAISSITNQMVSSDRNALEHQIKRLVFRNEVHRNFPQILDRVQEMDHFLLELFKFFENERIEEAALSGFTQSTSTLEEAVSKKLEKLLSSNPSLRDEPIVSQANENDIKKRDSIGKRWWKILFLNAGRKTNKPEGDQDIENQNVRDLWNSQIEFFLSCLGFIVGVGNTLRFPSMIFRYGGAFFIPYVFCLIVFGLPLVYMHLCIGQYSGLSASGAFGEMMPIASGIGWALVLLAVPVAIYYNIIVAWSLYYLWYSFLGVFSSTGLSWNECEPEWVTRFNCCELQAPAQCYANDYALTSPEAFFHYQVLNRTLIDSATLGQYKAICCCAWPFLGYCILRSLQRTWLHWMGCYIHSYCTLPPSVYIVVERNIA